MKKRNNRGITLIALMITIIVMLILAGVSLNAIIGDNGIITNAQTANMKSGMATLEEWLQEKYVEYYDEANNYAKKPLLLNDKINNLLLTDGGRPYIMNGGKVYYLVNKSSLPKEVREQLIGGNTTEYGKYIRLQDVYGITEDLKVYYCDENGNNTYGEMVVANIDPNTPIGKINNNNSLKTALSDALKDIGVTVNDEDGVTMGNVENLNTLELDGSKYNISSLSGLGEVRGLRTLTLSNLGTSSNYLSGLDGLESLPDLYYIYFKNCYISDYSKLSDCWRLQYLYMYLPPAMVELDANNQVTNLGNGLGRANNLTRLEYFGVSGVAQWFDGTNSKSAIYESEEPGKVSTLNDASGLTNVSNTIKDKISYLVFSNVSISTFDFLSDWSALVTANLTANPNITNLSEFGKHENLETVNFSTCKLLNLKRIRELYWAD